MWARGIITPNVALAPACHLLILLRAGRLARPTTGELHPLLSAGKAQVAVHLHGVLLGGETEPVALLLASLTGGRASWPGDEP